MIDCAGTGTQGPSCTSGPSGVSIRPPWKCAEQIPESGGCFLRKRGLGLFPTTHR
jgi:hypothetical protein